MSKIEAKDISIVVQGKNIPQHTEICLKTLRKNFPEAEIIFSTYENEITKNLDFDILAVSRDPGATHMFGSMYNNINRILQTTRAGLQRASRKYCLKIRSDLYFANDKLLDNLAQKFPARETKYAIFEERVIFYCLWSRKWEYIAGEHYILSPFYLSDWLCFGLLQDVKNYFMETPFTNEPHYTRFFRNPNNRRQGFWDPNVTWRFSPEQYFATNFFKKYFPAAQMKSLQDVTPERAEISRRILASNVIVCGYRECGVYIQKKNYEYISKHIEYLKGTWLGGVFRYADFLYDYKKYCDPSFKIPFFYFWISHYELDHEMNRLKKHFHRLTLPLKRLVKWFEQPFSIIYYMGKIAYKTMWMLYIRIRED